MPLDLSPTLIALLAFGAVAVVVFVVGQLVAVGMRVQQRVATQVQNAEAEGNTASGLESLISTYFDEKRFGLEGAVRAKLRRELVHAGFFRPDAVNYYIFARFAAVVVLTAVGYFLVEQFMVNQQWYIKFGAVAISMLLAILGPDAYIARRTRILQQEYRISFPDMLDLLVVCVDAGLSLEAALDRISAEITQNNPELGTNLLLLGAETRAGRSTIDALSSFADRLGLDEARSLVAMLRQSVELGTDVGDALRVYSDEMRDRRLMRAEERANQLPVKMVGPLGMFIFPVILGLIMVPVIIRLTSMGR